MRRGLRGDWNDRESSNFGGRVAGGQIVRDSGSGWSADAARHYWEQRARRFARIEDGLPAVCSFGMPRFYNAYIQATQRRALAPFLHVSAGDAVLDVGCGVGRWSLPMAAAGADVTGVDLSPSMVAEASRRAAARGLAARCRFLECDLAELDLEQRFSRIVIVTVLQHILDEQRLRSAIARLARHLRPGGRIVALEAAPTRGETSCDTGVFQARSEQYYRARFSEAGLALRALRGVDSAPWKTRFLPRYAGMPHWLRIPALAAIAAVSAPFDLIASPHLASWSWHKVFVLEPHSDARCARLAGGS
jgi:2-polyprenyl-3-methyl-5-hydroxy-6-metoxy-1,4-benzoquinol methylase